MSRVRVVDNLCSQYDRKMKGDVIKQMLKRNKVVNKIMTINRLSIPEVLVDIIKDYLFIDEKTAVTKYNKKKIVAQINALCYDSSRSKYYNIGRWSLRALAPPSGYMFMGGQNCTKCGNYLQDYMSEIPERVRCNINCPMNYVHQAARMNEIIGEEAELSWYNVWVDSDEEDEYEEDVW